jgi:3-dehydroquinate dehydratase
MALQLKSGFAPSHVSFDAKDAIEQARINLERQVSMREDEEEYRLYSSIRRSRRAVGSNILNMKGFGHKTIGAKRHGKSVVPTAGSGHDRYSAQRLFRVM